MIKIEQRLKEIRERGLLRRVATVGAIDADARTVELAFSSETESVERWFGIEVLGHDAGEVNMERLVNGAPVLWMHNWRDQRGVVESARIDGDRVGRAVVRFSRSAEGEQLFQDIVDGIVTKVSVGYSVEGLRLVEERDDTPVYRITSWTPYEISLVSIAADDTVGVGRALEIPQEETRGNAGEEPGSCPNGLPNVRTVNTMEKIVRDGQGNLVRAKVNEDGSIAETIEVIERAGEAQAAARRAGEDAANARVRAISQLGNEYGAAERAAEFIRDGRSVEEFRTAVLADFMAERSRGGSQSLEEQNGGAGIGMSERDIRNYSLMRVVRALANPQDRAIQEAAAHEIECSAAAARLYGREARGLIIPADVLGSRAFNAGGAANSPAGAQSGANLVATELSGSFIDMLRNRTTIMQLGNVMGGLVGNVDIPKQTGGATAYWVGEGDDASEGTPSLGQISLNPKTVAAYTDITRRLAMQSTPDAEGLVIRDLRAAMSQAIDKAGYYGSGTDNQPLGLKNYTGINAVDFGAAGQPTFAELVKMETEIATDNADLGSMAYVGNAKFRGHCKTTPKFGAGTEATIWEGGNTVNGYRTEITNQVADDNVFFGNYADLIIALWGGLDLTVDPFSLSKSGGLRLVVFQDVDFVLRRVESICFGSSTVA